DALRRREPAVPHHRINELLNQVARIHRIRQHRAARNESFAWHDASPTFSLFLRSLGPLGAVFRAPLLAIIHTGRIECAAYDVITNSREILHAAPAYEHDRVLLQVMSDSGDVRRHFDAISQPCPSYL